MLHEKLVVVSGDLVVKSRVKELEINLLDDKLSLKKTAETFLKSSGFLTLLFYFTFHQLCQLVSDPCLLILASC